MKVTMVYPGSCSRPSEARRGDQRSGSPGNCAEFFSTGELPERGAYQGASQTASFEAIEEKISHNHRLVLEESEAKKILPRDAAVDLGVQRVRKAMSYKLASEP